MKRYPLILSSLCVATAIATPISYAQSTQPDHQHSDSYKHEKSSESNAAKDLKEIRLSKLIGINVTDKDGTNLGQVQDIVLNPKTGKIRFALVGQGFMAGQGQTLFPVPWQAVNVHSERQFVLNVDQQKFKTGPAWSETQLEEPDYVVKVYRFYELEPQSDMGTSGSEDQQSGTGSSSSDKTQQDPQSSQPRQHE